MNGELIYSYGQRYLASVCAVSFEIRWVAELPFRTTAHVFITAEGEILVLGTLPLEGLETYPAVRLAPTGEQIAAYERDPWRYVVALQPGCGLFMWNYRRMQWCDLDMEACREVGPRDVELEQLSGTTDCGMFYAPRARTLQRFRPGEPEPAWEADIPGVAAMPPIPLADGGALVVLDRPGYATFGPDGSLTAEVLLDPTRSGQLTLTRTALLAPDGILYLAGYWGLESEIAFSAVDTGAIPEGPFLWDRSGMNWARSNSPLPVP